jgi:DNA replication protein DnaC
MITHFYSSKLYHARSQRKTWLAECLLLDDFGMQPLNNGSRMIFLEIIEDRHGRRSTLIGSQLPVSKWYEVIGDSTVADAILDRMVHTSHRIELKGESMRKTKK